MALYEKDPTWAPWRRKRLEPLGVGYVVPEPTDAWKTEMRPAGQPQPRDLRIEEYRKLREAVLGPVMPPEYRQYLGPQPSSAHSRLYEHLRNEAARELATQLRNIYPDQTTRKGPPIDPN